MTKLKFAHRADAHVGAPHMGRILEDGGSTALAGQRNALLDFLEAAHLRGVVGILNAGDETHTPRPAPDALDVLFEYHERREDYGIREFVVEGNHTDRPGVTVTDLAGRYARVYHATEPQSLIARFSASNAEEGVYQVQMAFLPWLPRNRVKSAEELTAAAVDYVRGLAATLDPTVPSILIVHATIAGGETSSGFSMGFIPDELGYKIPAEELAPFTYVAAGHLHRPQQVAPNAWYSGSLFPVDFAEDRPHGWNLVTLCDRNDAEPLAGPQPWHAHVEFVPLATPPVLTAEVHYDAVNDYVPENVRGALVRARVHVDQGGARFPAAVSSALYDAGALFVQTEVVRPVRAPAAAAGKLLAPLEALTHALGDREDAAAVLELAAEQLERLAVASGAGGLGTLHLRRIEAENIMRIAHANIGFDGAGIVSITGPVGSGKSALFCDVPRLALTGSSRMGERAGADLIRDGATYGEAILELGADDGRAFRFIRGFRHKRGGGVTSTLSVLEQQPGSLWGPLTDGKVASGDAMIAQLTGGLDDRTLKASTFVVQRESDAFTSARPEDRKRVLADAAGLSHLDTLAQDALGLGREANALAIHRESTANALRPKIAELTGLEGERKELEDGIAENVPFVNQLAARERTAEADVDAAVSRATERTAAEGAAVQANRMHSGLQNDQANAELDLSAMLQRRDDLAVLEARLASIGDTASAVQLALAQRDKAYADRQREEKARSERDDATRAIERLRSAREREAAILTRKIDAAEQRRSLIDKAACCAPEPECVFLDDARLELASIPGLSDQLDGISGEDPDEEPFLAIIATANALGASEPLLDLRPLEDNLRACTTRELARRNEIDRRVQLAGDVARIPELEARVANLQARVDEAQAVLDAAQERLASFAAENVDELRHIASKARVVHEEGRRSIADAQVRLGYVRGRIEALEEGREELRIAEFEAAVARTRADHFGTLNAGWKSARVLILEHSIIPSVERTANEILALSPTGLTLRLDRSAGDDLELRLEGGLAPSYKLASGGQRTWLDVALHIAIALIVAQRVQTRLDFLFVDEPEGLDVENRAHFGRVLRWVHDTHGLTVLAASHHEDLVELIADRVITLAPMAEGTTV